MILCLGTVITCLPVLVLVTVANKRTLLRLVFKHWQILRRRIREYMFYDLSRMDINDPANIDSRYQPPSHPHHPTHLTYPTHPTYPSQAPNHYLPLPANNEESFHAWWAVSISVICLGVNDITLRWDRIASMPVSHASSSTAGPSSQPANTPTNPWVYVQWLGSVTILIIISHFRIAHPRTCTLVVATMGEHSLAICEYY